MLLCIYTPTPEDNIIHPTSIYIFITIRLRLFDSDDIWHLVWFRHYVHAVVRN